MQSEMSRLPRCEQLHGARKDKDKAEPVEEIEAVAASHKDFEWDHKGHRHALRVRSDLQRGAATRPKWTRRTETMQHLANGDPAAQGEGAGAV